MPNYQLQKITQTPPAQEKGFKQKGGKQVKIPKRLITFLWIQVVTAAGPIRFSDYYQ